jgi:regulator of protease activity HflC (stomatin/prohibitin superfamily)
MVNYRNISNDVDTLKRATKRLLFLVIVFFVVLTLLFGSFFVVQPGEQALVFNSFVGLKETVYGEGLHFKVPFIDSAIKMNIRVQKQQEIVAAASKDLQDVSAEVAVNFQIDKAQIVDIYRRVGKATTGEDYMQSQIMNPIIQESVKSITAEYTAEELITKRPAVKNEIDKVIKERLSAYNIIVTDISITDFKFSDVFTRAIEEKVVSLQTALKEENNLKVVQFQAQQMIEKSRGEAQSIEIINKQLMQSPQYVNYLTIQRWDGKMPLALGSGSLLSITGG